MISFLFPEDLDPRPSVPNQCTSPMSKKCRDAFPTYERVEASLADLSHQQPTAPSHGAPPPPPLIAIPTPRKEPIISITSVNMSTGSHKYTRSGPLIRFGSLSSRSKQEREEQRAEKRRVKAEKMAAKVMAPLSPVVDEEFWNTGRYTEYREQFAYVAF